MGSNLSYATFKVQILIIIQYNLSTLIGERERLVPERLKVDGGRVARPQVCLVALLGPHIKAKALVCQVPNLLGGRVILPLLVGVRAVAGP